MTPDALFSAVLPVFQGLGVKVLFEPGRSLTANAGALISRVILSKETGERKFVIVDAGMNDFIRPSLYDAYHQIVVVEKGKRALEKVFVVGPICETGDFFSHERFLPKVHRGELLAIMATGAYGYALSSNYNGRLRPPEVLVNGASTRMIRERECLEDLWRGVDES